VVGTSSVKRNTNLLQDKLFENLFL